ncbi:unnamed protein product [Orchesella dallaii]|uniref:carbonic anhydrase n=1 Tax=Orchesella dallaii TaxID=48710 RepID=A0ABP1PKY8_9HEXA
MHNLHVTSISILITIFCRNPHICFGIGIRQHEAGFCYSDPTCSFSSEFWGDFCQLGRRQSPIDIPEEQFLTFIPFEIFLQSQFYSRDWFFIRNNGHTLSLDLLHGERHQDEHHRFYLFPVRNYPEEGMNSLRVYQLESAHFHWGKESSLGSEHCFQGRCFSMELHLVHYLEDYPNLRAAIDSGDPDAVAVLGIMLVASNYVGRSSVLAPILRHIPTVLEAGPEPGIRVHERLDFMPWLEPQNFLYQYEGSLTTPSPLECYEQVSWFLGGVPIEISEEDVEQFRRLRDENGEELRENRRPIQSLNLRDVYRYPSIAIE